MPSKSVPLTPIKVWKGHQPSLEHIHIWECPAHVLKPKVDKLETRFKVCQFVGYPKGMRGHYFYTQIDQKVLVSLNFRFLENDYMMRNKARHDIDWKHLKTLPH